MIKEILSSLMGIQGELVIENNKSFIINPKISFLNEDDKEELNNIVKYGYYINQIDFFSKFFKNKFLENILNNNNHKEKDFISKYLYKLSDYFLKFVNDFQNLILEIENEFLKGKDFDLYYILIKISDKIDIILDLFELINIIHSNKIKGGKLLNLIIEKSMNGNKRIEEFYNECFNFWFDFFLEDLFKWIFYGKIDDKFNEFFINKNKNKLFLKNKITNKNLKKLKRTQENWNNFASIRYLMIPNYIFNSKTAEIILFIGKAVRVINDSKGSLYCENILREYYNEIKFLKNKSNFYFINIIDKIRVRISNEFYKVISDEFDIRENIIFINNYLLMKNDEFYQIFFDESKDMIESIQSKANELLINNKCLQNSILRLENYLKDIDKLKLLQFKFNYIGFEFLNFDKISNLIFKNSIDNNNELLRFSNNNNLYSSLWYSLKQSVEFGFNHQISFKIKRNLDNNLLFENNYSLIVIIQNYIDIKFSKFYNPQIENINEYFAIKINIFIDKNGIENSELLILIKKKLFDSISQTKTNIIKELGKVNLTKLGIKFDDQDIKNLKIINEKNKLYVILLHNNIINETPIFECNLDIKENLNLDYGSAYIGIIYENKVNDYFLDLYNWKYQGFSLLSEYKNFNILIPIYEFEWPLNLLLSPELLNNIKMIFTFLFPIKFVYFNLKELILEIKNAKKKQNLNSYIIKWIYGLKNIFSNFYYNLLNYIFIDIIENYTMKFNEKIKCIKNFDDINLEIKNYYNNIIKDLFFNHSLILENINKINYLVFSFCNFYKDIDNFDLEEIRISWNNMKEEFNVSLNKIINFINYLLTQGVYENYNKFLDWINFNEFYQELNN